MIQNFSISPLRAPLIQPFRVATGEHKILDNLLFVLELKGGIKGFGEAAIATHITKETVEETTKNLKTIGQALLGRNTGDYLKISLELNEQWPKNKAAVAAVESALMDALTKTRKIPLWKFFGSRPKRLVSDITIVIADLAETENSVKKFYKQGFRAFKVKIGRDEDLDFKRVSAVKRLAPRCRIYLDANQGYSASQTLNFLKILKKHGIKPDLMEQPVPKEDFEGLKKVTQLSRIPVCADESAASLVDTLRLIHEKAVNVISVKLVKSGLFQAREIAQSAQKSGIKLMISGMMESSLAMTTAAHLAAGLGYFDFIDLDTPFFIQDGSVNNPYLNSKGVYDLRKVKEGVGINISDV